MEVGQGPNWGCSAKKKGINLSLWLINKAPLYEDACGSGGIASQFLTSARDGGKYSASHPGHFTPRRKSLSTHWIGALMGLRVGLYAVEY
jgi:hypothetical protein